jgi:hypothetical protein
MMNGWYGHRLDLNHPTHQDEKPIFAEWLARGEMAEGAFTVRRTSQRRAK